MTAEFHRARVSFLKGSVGLIKAPLAVSHREDVDVNRCSLLRRDSAKTLKLEGGAGKRRCVAISPKLQKLLGHLFAPRMDTVLTESLPWSASSSIKEILTDSCCLPTGGRGRKEMTFD